MKMTKYFIFIILLLIIILSLIELQCCKKTFLTLLDTTEINDLIKFQTDNETIYASSQNINLNNKEGKYYKIIPTVLLYSQIENLIGKTVIGIKNISKNTFITDIFNISKPILESISAPYQISLKPSLNFISSNPKTKILMTIHNNKEYYYV